MLNRKRDGLRTWLIGTAATGLLWQSLPTIGNAEGPAPLFKKKTVAKPAATNATTPPRLLPTTDENQPGRSSIQQVGDVQLVAGEKSEVQKQLEVLYQQDGREMPNMNFNLQPISPNNAPNNGPNAEAPQSPTYSANTGRPAQNPVPPQQVPQGTQKPARSGQGYTQYQPKPPASPYPTPTVGQMPRNYGQAFDAQNAPQSPPRQKSVASLFKKLTGNNKPPAGPVTSQPPLPPDYNNAGNIANNSLQSHPPTNVTKLPSMPPATNSYAGSASTVHKTPEYPRPVMQPARPVTQPVLANATVQTPPQRPTQVQSASVVTPALVETPQPSLPMPALSRQAVPIYVTTAVAAAPAVSAVPSEVAVHGTVNELNSRPVKSVPPSRLQGSAEFQPPIVDETTERELVSRQQPVPVPRNSTASRGPTNVSAVRTRPVATPAVKPEVAAHVEPVVPEPVELVTEAGDEPKRISDANQDEDPYAVEAKDFVEPLIVENNASTSDATGEDPTAPSLEAPGVLELSTTVEERPPVSEKRVEESPSREEVEVAISESVEELQREKMQKIRERFGMKGLKGFCPVTLRDQRELVDAKPEFASTHRSQKFHFSSAAAREKFAANPLRYRPAAYGADVVALSRDKDVVEGTLDFASWYKGRLYLFGSQENYDAFVEDPSQFATLDGLE